MNKKIMLTIAVLGAIFFGCQDDHPDTYANRHIPANPYHSPESQLVRQEDPRDGNETETQPIATAPILPAPHNSYAIAPRKKGAIVDGLIAAMCEGSANALFLPKLHNAPDCHETMVIIPYQDDDGDVFEVYAQLKWGSSDSSWATIHHPENDNKQTVIWGMASKDIFDSADAREPHAVFTGCVENDCDTDDNSCIPQICKMINVYGIVNLESPWCFVSSLQEDPTCEEMTISQDGRFLSFEEWHRHGIVTDASVSWRMNGKRYEGTIEPSRTVMNGRIIEEMMDEQIGTWSAWR